MKRYFLLNLAHNQHNLHQIFFFFLDKVLPFPISNKALLLDSTPSFTPNIAPSLPIATCSSHISRPPSYLHDYHCSLISSICPSTSHPLSQVLGYEKLSSNHKGFDHALSSNFELGSYSEAVVIQKWKEAMDAELRALKSNGTWSLTTLPLGKHTMGCKWIYKIKYQADGTLEQYKAWLVTKGFTQQEGIDNLNTSSPSPKPIKIEVLLALVAIYGWSLTQLDVNNTFLHDNLVEEVYMALPPGLHHEGESFSPNTVCKLHKSLYGLKQASQ